MSRGDSQLHHPDGVCSQPDPGGSGACAMSGTEGAAALRGAPLGLLPSAEAFLSAKLPRGENLAGLDSQNGTTQTMVLRELPDADLRALPARVVNSPVRAAESRSESLRTPTWSDSESATAR